MQKQGHSRCAGLALRIGLGLVAMTWACPAGAEMRTFSSVGEHRPSGGESLGDARHLAYLDARSSLLDQLAAFCAGLPSTSALPLNGQDWSAVVSGLLEPTEHVSRTQEHGVAMVRVSLVTKIDRGSLIRRLRAAARNEMVLAELREAWLESRQLAAMPGGRDASASGAPPDSQAEADRRRALALRSDVDEMLARAWGLYVGASSEREHAKGFVLTALAMAPDSGPGQRALGVLLAEAGDVGGAVRALEEADRLRPASALTQLRFGLVLALQGNRPAALQRQRRAVELAPDQAAARLGLGRTLLLDGQAEAALAEFRHAVRLAPKSAEAHVALGRAIEAAGSLDQAVIEYQAAIQLDPTAAEGHFHLGNLWQRRGLAGEAVKELQEAIRLEPGLESRSHRVGAPSALAQGVPSADGLGPAAHRRVDAEQFRYSLGLALFARGDAEGAAAEYRAALRHRPDFIEARVRLGQALTALKDVDRAILELRTAIRLRPESGDAHAQLGAALLAKGDRAGAKEAWHRALRIDPANVTARLGMAQVARETGNPQEGIRWLEETVKLHPDDASAHAALASAWEAQGKRKEAAEELREFLRLVPVTKENHRLIRRTLGRIRLLEEHLSYEAAPR